MKLKKLFWMIVFIVIVVAFVVLFVKSTYQEPKDLIVPNIAFNNATSNQPVTIVSDNLEPYKEKIVDSGVLYSLSENEEYNADIVLKDKYFDTTIRDMNLNSSDYLGKTVEIEGLYFNNGYYSFVGRYTTSNLCPTCPPGYSFMEFHLNGTIDREFTNEGDWIKVIGTYKVGNDESSNNEDYYYLDVLSLEVMNEKGNDTVSD